MKRMSTCIMFRKTNPPNVKINPPIVYGCNTDAFVSTVKGQWVERVWNIVHEPLNADADTGTGRWSGRLVLIGRCDLIV